MIHSNPGFLLRSIIALSAEGYPSPAAHADALEGAFEVCPKADPTTFAVAFAAAVDARNAAAVARLRAAARTHAHAYEFAGTAGGGLQATPADLPAPPPPPVASQHTVNAPGSTPRADYLAALEAAREGAPSVPTGETPAWRRARLAAERSGR